MEWLNQAKLRSLNSLAIYGRKHHKQWALNFLLRHPVGEESIGPDVEIIFEPYPLRFLGGLLLNYLLQFPVFLNKLSSDFIM